VAWAKHSEGVLCMLLCVLSNPPQPSLVRRLASVKKNSDMLERGYWFVDHSLLWVGVMESKQPITLIVSSLLAIPAGLGYGSVYPVTLV